MLQSMHLDKCLLKQQNTEKLEGTKNITACMLSRGKFMDKIQKKHKNPTATSEELGAKIRRKEQN